MNRLSQVTASEISRRELLKGGGLLLGTLALRVRPARGQKAPVLSEAVRDALSKSPLVYVSPLHPDGSESRCHGEVWFFCDGEDVVIGTAAERWKAAAVRKGWDRARIWVGDFGPVSRAGEKFRDAPSFEVRASFDTSPATFERLLSAFAERYPDAWGKWESRFKDSYRDGSRVLIRYAPLPQTEP